ncbi:MAG: diphthine--ammonia ligase [Spirochaetales bacterium]|nr:diphthine--ammonia ligase [Spirochaetales bacterium]
MNNLRAFVSWSGGKDSCLSLYRSMNNYQLSHLLTMIAENGNYSRSHGLTIDVLSAQAEAMGLPILMQKTTWEAYEEEFKKAVRQLSCTTGIFGDIDLQAHRDWVERVSKEVDVRPVLPLWNSKREDLMHEFIDAGFKAIIITVNTHYLGKEWLGRIVDNELIRDLEKHGNVDIAGENGEYHTFVYDGPVFRKPVQFSQGRQIPVDEYYFQEVLLSRS